MLLNRDPRKFLIFRIEWRRLWSKFLLCVGRGSFHTFNLSFVFWLCLSWAEGAGVLSYKAPPLDLPSLISWTQIYYCYSWNNIVLELYGIEGRVRFYLIPLKAFGRMLLHLVSLLRSKNLSCPGCSKHSISTTLSRCELTQISTSH